MHEIGSARPSGRARASRARPEAGGATARLIRENPRFVKKICANPRPVLKSATS
jgi:hypothetical protein